MTHPDDPLLPCPPWCSGSHVGQSPSPGDRFHESRPVVFEVRTGVVDVEFAAAIVQYPLSTRPDRRDVYAWGHLTATVTMNRPSDVNALADMLVGYAARLRTVADELVVAQQQDRVRVEADLKDAGREG